MSSFGWPGHIGREILCVYIRKIIALPPKSQLITCLSHISSVRTSPCFYKHRYLQTNYLGRPLRCRSTATFALRGDSESLLVRAFCVEHWCLDRAAPIAWELWAVWHTYGRQSAPLGHSQQTRSPAKGLSSTPITDWRLPVRFCQPRGQISP